jgi:hypothetical protein
MSAERAASAAPVGSSPPADGGVRATGPQVQVNEELHYVVRRLDVTR